MKEKKEIETCRHSTAHLMAQAVKELFPGTKLGIGPAIEEGFYYDFDCEKSLTPEDLKKIEKKMEEIIKRDLPFERTQVPKSEAGKVFKERGENYKLELLEEIREEKVTLYKNGDFIDLCRGPHLKSTGEIKAFKLLNLAGAYWRGDERNPMLQRIYGTAFYEKKDLDGFLERREEAKKRDHRKLGKDLDLFSFHEEGPGFVFWHPKGLALYDAILDFWREEHRKRGYLEVSTPLILSQSLWERSGHLGHYKKNMYFLKIEERNFAIKPMNCPGGLLIYKNSLHSYRDFPLRISELGLVHRHEMSGVLQGLFRVRSFTQDDAHIYCTDEQIEEEIAGVIDLVLYIYKIFGFEDYSIELSTRPKDAMGSGEIWEKATSALKGALKEQGIAYEINEGEGAFYGPKIDFHIKDCLGRSWQCGTIQLDFAMPEGLDIEYVGKDGKKHRPVMIHRAILGSIERFTGILIEHYGGAFPAWLAPVQTRVMNITERQSEYARQVAERIGKQGIRTEAELRNEKIGHKIREAQLQKIPYMLIVGDREKDRDSVAVRKRNGEDLGLVKVDEFIKNILEEIANKK
jgi:threonyl-tRNA synthetase